MGVRFLVVDDDPAVGRQLARVVRPFGEGIVAGSVSGAMAMLASRVAWDGFFVDLGLPDGSGLDVVSAARKAFPARRAMVLTGNVDPGLINAVHDLGASYVVKPVDSARIARFCSEITTPKARGRGAGASGRSVPATLDGCVARLRELFPMRIDPLVRYAIGAVVAEIKARPERYGTSGVTTVAAALGEDAPSLYRHATVAECWNEAEVRELLSRQGPDGRRLSWSHVVLLGHVTSSALRKRLENRALDEGMSVRQLAEAVAAQAQASVRGRGDDRTRSAAGPGSSTRD